MGFVVDQDREKMLIAEHYDRGFAFVDLGSQEAVARAVSASRGEGIKVGDKKLTVEPSKKPVRPSGLKAMQDRRFFPAPSQSKQSAAPSADSGSRGASASSGGRGGRGGGVTSHTPPFSFLNLLIFNSHESAYLTRASGVFSLPCSLQRGDRGGRSAGRGEKEGRGGSRS